MATQSTLTRYELEHQANQIDWVLANHRVNSRVTGGQVSKRWVRYNLTAPPNARVAVVRNLSEELALALHTKDVRVTRDGGSLAVEVPRPDAEPILLAQMLRSMRMVPPLTAVLGMAEDGRPLLLHLPSPDVAHVLVAGMTGSGKTEVMRTIIWSLCVANRQSKMQLVLIDPKRRGFGIFSDLPHLMTPLITDTDKATQTLQRVVAEMERRDRENISTPHIIVAVDEGTDLLMTGGKEVEALLTRIAQRGREAGVHLLMGAQNPASKLFGSMLKANFPVRLIGRVSSANDARVAAGIAGSNAEKLLGKGDFLAVSAGNVTRFQAAHAPMEDWHHLNAAIYHNKPLIGNA